MHYIRFSTNPFVHAQFMPVPNNFHPFKGQELAKGLHQRKLTSNKTIRGVGFEILYIRETRG